jgi:hypothetical protein
MNAVALRRAARRESAAAAEQEAELPGSVLRVLDGTKLHQRPSGDEERILVCIPGIQALPFIGPDQAAKALSAHFDLQPRQLEAAVGYLSRVVKIRRRELKRQRRGTGFALRWKEEL